MKTPSLSFTILALLASIVTLVVGFDPGSFRLIDPIFSPLNTTKKFTITAGIETYYHTINFILENNDDLVSPDVQIRYPDVHQHANGAVALPNTPVRFTKGSVWIQETPKGNRENVGWARLAVIQDGESLLFDGAFTMMGLQYAIVLETLDDGSTEIIARQHESAFSGRSLSPSLCATAPETHLDKRQIWNAWNENLASTIGNTYGCPNTREIAYIGIITDCTYTASFNSSDSAHRYILNMVNTASVVFENSFNISLAIQNLTISDAECPSSTSGRTAWNVPCSQGDLNTRLQTFSSWRSSVNDRNAYWTLLTGCSVSAGEIGVSWIGALCNTGSGSRNGGASANVVARTQNEWQVFAKPRVGPYIRSSSRLHFKYMWKCLDTMLSILIKYL
ncbi:Peptidase M12B, ADAM/reprolysin [Penicillium griseofulvum]|uniref:Peptidase M12B, ADAM/reprolysin n=1 Tax=Penicillium patulum TaxID=5078 RepID=A0A135LS72_PENPA|nr:Peptidase M12B, ADAM/reprolysin [Penicillium griseofulvum]KXG51813.1 Peptidase M12B, ADAM/reprolysin [Penicillium griseofulvum]